MFRYLFLSVVSIFFLTACDLSGEDTPEAKRYELLQKLDEGDYDFVIQKLENDKSYQEAFRKDERYVNLAAAYIGKAGYDINSLINDMIDSDEGNGDAYQGFIKALSHRINGDSVSLLDKAVELYKEALGDNITDINTYCENNSDNLTPYQKDACFYVGLVETAKATSSVGLLLKGGTNPSQDGTVSDIIQKWIEQDENENPNVCDLDDIDNNGVIDPADAAACEIEYATKQKCSNKHITTSTETVTFTKGSKTYNYTLLKITLSPDTTVCAGKNPKHYKKLISLDKNLPVLSDTYCKTDFTPCDEGTEGCYPCPVIDPTGDDIDVGEAVIDAINNGADSLISTLPEDEQNEVKDAIKDFTKDLCKPDPSACLCDGVECTPLTLNTAKEIKIKPDRVDLLSKYIKGDE